MPLRFQCPCGDTYREDSAHGNICKESNYPHDRIATQEKKGECKHYCKKRVSLLKEIVCKEYGPGAFQLICRIDGYTASTEVDYCPFCGEEAPASKPKS